MIAPTQIRKPKNWQDFEELCKRLWGEIWECSDTILRNGQSGQSQNGVDIYGVPKGKNVYYGIQCKLKDENSKSKLSKNEIDEEIRKAKTFKPTLARYIIATTANKDAKVEEYIRIKNVEHREKGTFELYIFFWEDIEDLIDENPNTSHWYLNNCQYKDTSNVKVLFKNGSEHAEISPQYIQITLKTKIKRSFSAYDWLNDSSNYFELTHESIDYNETIQPLYKSFPHLYYKKDFRWCNIDMFVVNVGNTTIEECKLKIIFEPNKIIELDPGYNYCNNPAINSAERAQYNSHIDNIRDVYLTDKKNIIFVPKHALVRNDYAHFSFDLLPQDNVNEIKVSWELLSRDYNTNGELLIKVVPQYEEQIKYKEVENESEMKEDEIQIAPKIICVRR